MNARDWIALQMLAQQSGPWQLHRPALRVFFFVAADLDIREYRPIKQTRIARAIGVGQPAVSKALRALVCAGYLEVGEYRGGLKTYRLNRRQVAIEGLFAA